MPQSSKKTASKSVKARSQQKKSWYGRMFDSIRNYRDALYARNPHKTLQLTRRRDYVRPLELPNPLLFILEVIQTIWRQKRFFLPLMAIYIVLYAVLVGIASESTYAELTNSVEEASSKIETTEVNPLTKASATLVSFASNGFGVNSGEAQQIFGVLLGLIAWLTTVWLLRNIFAGNNVKVRDGLYNAGAPIIAMAIIVLVILVQLLPVALAAIAYAAATSSGLILNGGVEAMLFWIAAGLLGLLSAYWVTSSIFALVIVTLPGMYPIKALQASRKILIGRKLRFALRFAWMAVFIIALWVVVLLPMILFDGWLKAAVPQLEWLPLVPIIALILSTYTVFWTSTYIYLLYRKVVDND